MQRKHQSHEQQPTSGFTIQLSALQCRNLNCVIYIKNVYEYIYVLVACWLFRRQFCSAKLGKHLNIYTQVCANATCNRSAGSILSTVCQLSKTTSTRNEYTRKTLNTIQETGQSGSRKSWKCASSYHKILKLHD